MQIVIDIPEEIYNSACATNNIWDMRMAGFVCSAIAKGTPLDNIRAEIAEEHNDCMGAEHYDEAYGLELALGIIDKYKRESEE